MNEPIGRFGSCRPARARRTARDTACTASPLADDAIWPSSSSMRSSLSRSPSSILSTGMPVQRETTCAMWSGVTTSSHHAHSLCRPWLRLRRAASRARDDAIGKLAGALEFALALRDRQLVAGLVELLLEVGGEAELLLLRLPAGRQRIGLLLERGELELELFEPVLRGAIGFLLQRLALDLELHDAAVELVELLGLGIDLHAQARCRLVHQVDRLVGQEAVGDVAVGQRRGRTPARNR